MSEAECEHDFQKIRGKEKPSLFARLLYWFLPPNTYSKCSKCGLMRHDKDGHTFRTVKEGYESALE